jgi:hypothetical protein
MKDVDDEVLPAAIAFPASPTTTAPAAAATRYVNRLVLIVVLLSSAWQQRLRNL